VDEQKSGRLEALQAVLLGIAAVLTAFAAYQASLKDGDTIKTYNQGILAITESNAFYNQYGQKVDNDESLFLEWAKADEQGDDELRDFIRTQLMEPNLRRALKAYNRPGNPDATPTETKVYDDSDFKEAQRLERVTERRFERAQRIDAAGDRYELAGVIGAVSLFFLGIGGVFRAPRLKVAATAMGAGVLVVCGVMLLSA
jgi:hypothetical protein